MTSSHRPGETPSNSGGQPHDENVVVGPHGSGSVPVSDDEQTVISNRSPLSPGSNDFSLGIDQGNLKQGDELGPYKIVAFVGGGGMGRVYRAVDTDLDREVALKVLPANQAGDSETVMRFRNEARSAARLDHENIVRVHHVGGENGVPYLVFEFVEGATIRTLVEQHGPLALQQAVSYTLQVADALVHADEHGVVHRDIKPSNIIVTAEGRVKVIDMGLARIQEMQESASDLTASGVTLGTFDYISPEQARDPRIVDVRSDIYSLGCAFFYMLAARPPFPEGTVLQKLLQHQGDRPPDIHEFRPEMPDEVSQVLQRMLAKDPSRRYQTPLELVEELQLLAEQIGLRPLGPGQRIWVAPKRPKVPVLQRHLPWVAPVVALLCIAFALHFLWNSTPSSGREKLVLKKPATSGSVEEERVDGPPNPDPEPSGQGASAEKDGAGMNATANPNSEGNAEQGTVDSRGADFPPRHGRNGGDSGSSLDLGPSGFPANSGFPDQTGMPPGIGETIDPFLFPEQQAYPNVGWEPVETSAAMAKNSGVLTVGLGGSRQRDYPTLAAACAAAKTGDIIELCFDGPRLERPFDLPNVKLVVRPRLGYRPILVFRPDQDDPVTYPRQMFTLAGGQLSLMKVAIELDLPRDLPAAPWVLWELGPTADLRLEEVSLTVRNASGHDVRVFRVKPSPGADLGGSSSEEPAATTIELTDCIIRGRATTLQAESLQPVRLTWTNGILATDEWLLRVHGGDREAAAGETISLRLRHLTALLGDGLCRLENTSITPSQQLAVRVDCSDSVIMVTSPRGAMVELVGDYPYNLEDWFTWTGDRNGYFGSTVLWRMDDLSEHMSPEVLDFQGWRSRWPDHELHSRFGRIDFASPLDSERSPDSLSSNDFRLSDNRDNWARGGASDGKDIGAELGQLPDTPTRPKMRPAGKESGL